MEDIKLHIERSTVISKFYDEKIRPNLYEYSKNIEKGIIDLLDNYASEYDLVLNNSVYEKISLYEITSRVKKSESLSEKLIRKSDIFNYDRFFEGKNIKKSILDDLDNNIYENELCKIICKIDDLIGIKILTSLNIDCSKVLDLLKNKINECEDIDLKLSGKIPDTMNNGRKIYKVKGIYKNTFKFELQIKSKIDSAWGDLEHNLFYKDYDFNYIKNTNKDIMVNIGVLLERVDELMLSVRTNKENFKKQYNELSFKNDLTKAYNDKVIEIFKSNYILEENLDLLYFLYKLSIGEYNNSEKFYDGDIHKHTLENKEIFILENYKKLKMNNFKIPLVELIYTNWIKFNNKYEHDEKLIDDLLSGIIRYRMIEYKNLTSIELEYDDFSYIITRILAENNIKFNEGNLLTDKKLFILIEIYRAIITIKTDILDGETEGYIELDEDNVEDFVNDIYLSLFKYIYDQDEISLEDDSDEKTFFIKLSNLVQKFKEDINEKHEEIINDTLSILNNIKKGGAYES